MIKNNDLIYEKVEKYISDLLNKGELKPGDRLLPERAIAEMFNTSTKPVRRAMEHFTTRGILEKIQGKGTFVKKAPATDKLTGRIGVLYCSNNQEYFRASFYAALFAGIESEARAQGKVILMKSVVGFANEPLLGTLDELADDVDGFLLVDPWPGVYRAMEPILKESTKPVVILNYEATDRAFDSVVFDSRENSRQAVEFLINAGHRRIRYVYCQTALSAAPHPNFVNRLTGAREAMEAHGLPWVDGMVTTVQELEQEDTFKVWIAEHAPTAIFSLGDIAVPRLYRLAGNNGISIPGDLSIIGYDDIKENAYLRPALTSNHTPLLEMGALGIRRLLERLQDAKQGIRVPHRLVLPGEIIERGSHRTIGPAE